MNKKYFSLVATLLAVASIQAGQMSNVANNQQALLQAVQATNSPVMQPDHVMWPHMENKNLLVPHSDLVVAKSGMHAHRLGRVNPKDTAGGGICMRLSSVEYPTAGSLPKSWWAVEQVFRELFMKKNHINPASLQGQKSDATVQAAWAQAEAEWNKSPEKVAFESYKAEEMQRMTMRQAQTLGNTIGTPYAGSHDGHVTEGALQNPATAVEPVAVQVPVAASLQMAVTK